MPPRFRYRYRRRASPDAAQGGGLRSTFLRPSAPPIRSADPICRSAYARSGAIHSGLRSGKSLSPNRRPSGDTMPRGLIFLVVILILLVGGLFLLSRSAEEVPVQTI